MIESFSLDFTRIGMLVYATTNDVIFDVENNLTKAQMSQWALNAGYPAGWTYTAEALLEGINMFNRSGSLGESSRGVPKIMTVFTDGEANGKCL